VSINEGMVLMNFDGKMYACYEQITNVCLWKINLKFIENNKKIFLDQIKFVSYVNHLLIPIHETFFFFPTISKQGQISSLLGYEIKKKNSKRKCEYYAN
jgi:hypothetical protein